MKSLKNQSLVVHGGSRLNSAEFCRAANRFINHPGYRIHYQGFRLVLQQPKEGAKKMQSSKNQALVVRGGSWLNSAEFCRAALCLDDHPGYRFHRLGFRLILSSIKKFSDSQPQLTFGDPVEVEVNGRWQSARFICFQSKLVNAVEVYICWAVRGKKNSIPQRYTHWRLPVIQRLKPGQPIFVWDDYDGKKHLRLFDCVNGSNIQVFSCLENDDQEFASFEYAHWRLPTHEELVEIGQANFGWLTIDQEEKKMKNPKRRYLVERGGSRLASAEASGLC